MPDDGPNPAVKPDVAGKSGGGGAPPDPGMDALGELICRLNPYTRLPKNDATGLKTGDMQVGMLPPADKQYAPSDLNSTIACMGIEVERNYRPTWSFKGQEQSVTAAVRIPYRFPVYKNDELAYWQTEYLLLGFVGGGGMG